MNATDTLPRRLYTVTVKVPTHAAPASLIIMATGRTDAILRMDEQLDGIGIREWALVSCEEVGR